MYKYELVFTKPRLFPSTCDIFMTLRKTGLSDLKASAEASALALASSISCGQSPNFGGKCQISYSGVAC